MPLPSSELRKYSILLLQIWINTKGSLWKETWPTPLSSSLAFMPSNLKDIHLLFTPFDMLNQHHPSKLNTKFLTWDLLSSFRLPTWYLKHASHLFLVEKFTGASLQLAPLLRLFLPIFTSEESPVKKALRITPFAYSWG